MCLVRIKCAAAFGIFVSNFSNDTTAIKMLIIGVIYLHLKYYFERNTGTDG